MPFKFYIENLYERTEIQEPDKWKDIVSVLDRDFSAHGMFFNYTEGTLKLGFACDAKIDLESAYQAYGTEAYYLFEVEQAETVHDTYSVIFSGEIDFSTRNYPENIWEAEVNTSTNQLLLKNRAKNKIGLNKSSSIDGLALGLMNKQVLAALATKTRDELIIQNTGAQVIAGSTALSGGAVSDVQIGFDTNEALGIKNYENLTTEVEISGAALSSDYFLRIDKPRAFKIDVEYDYELDMTEQQGSGTTSYTASLVINLYKNGKDLTGFGISLPSDSSASPNNWSTSDSGTTTFYRVFEAGTEFRATMSMVMGTTGTGEFDFDFVINNLKFSFVDLGTNTSTLHDWYNVHDSLNKILTHITDKYDFLYSEVLGGLMQGYDADGCLATLRQTNGYRMRQITDNSRAPILSFNDIVENLSVIQATGYGIEELESPIELGLFDVVWGLVYDPEASIILQGDQTYDIIEGDKIGFYNSPDIYGRYPIESVIYDSINDETTVYFDISANEDYHTNFDVLGFSYPVPGNTYENVFITCDSNTEVRERLRLENWEHFYSDNELIDLGVVEEYSEEPFNEAIYNQINLGFKKYGNDEESFSSRDDFHTNSQWSLPLRKSENTFSKIASWIGSTFMINESRDTLFSEKPTVSHKLDDDIFICDRSILIKDFTVSFAAGTNIMTVPEECYENFLVNSALIRVTGSVSNDGAYLYDDVSRDLENSEYDITLIGTLVNEASVLCTIEGFNDVFANNRSVAYKSEANENTIGINNLSSPEYTYNLRRSIKRFLFRWGDYIMSSMAYAVTNATRIVRNSFFVNNGELTSQAGYDSSCVDFWGSIVENEDVSSDDLGAVKFKPNLIHATKYICDEDYQMILDAHKNKAASNNYGYFSVDAPNDRLGSRQMGVFDGDDYMYARDMTLSDLDFIHQDCEFDIEMEVSFDNWESTTDFDYFLSTMLSAGSYGFHLAYTNSITGTANSLFGKLRNDTAESVFLIDIGDLFHDGKVRNLRVIGSGTNVSIIIEGVTFSNVLASAFVSGGGVAQYKLDIGTYTWAISPLTPSAHVGKFGYLTIKNALGTTLINYNFDNGDIEKVPNEGTLSNADIYWAYSPSYSDEVITTRKKSGWLIEMKRSPLTKIAKFKLLEKA